MGFQNERRMCFHVRQTRHGLPISSGTEPQTKIKHVLCAISNLSKTFENISILQILKQIVWEHKNWIKILLSIGSCVIYQYTIISHILIKLRNRLAYKKLNFISEFLCQFA